MSFLFYLNHIKIIAAVLSMYLFSKVCHLIHQLCLKLHTSVLVVVLLIIKVAAVRCSISRVLFPHIPGHLAAVGSQRVTELFIGICRLLWIWEQGLTLENQTNHQTLPFYLSYGKSPAVSTKWLD